METWGPQGGKIFTRPDLWFWRPLQMPDEKETLQPQAKTVELQKRGVATFPLSAFALSAGEVLSQRSAC